MRLLKPKRGDRLVDQAPTSKQLLEMAEITMAPDSMRAAPAVAIDTFQVLGNPFDDFAEAKERA